MSEQTSAQVDVLQIEDDDDMAAIVAHRLGRAGYTAQRVANGREGLRRLEQGPAPRMVMLDVMLPFVNGFDVLREIRERPQTRDLPVLMLTSLDREQDVVRGIRGGATEYMTKPFKPGELIERVRRLIGMPQAGSS